MVKEETGNSLKADTSLELQRYDHWGDTSLAHKLESWAKMEE